MISKYTSLLSLLFLFCSSTALSQNFEGRLYYENYNVEESDTTLSSTMSYWVKEHLYKHKGHVPKMALYDLGTLFADANEMSRTNLDNSGKLERIPMSLDAKIPNLSLAETDITENILGFECAVWDLINSDSNSLISKLWITTEIKNSNFDQFVELFNYGNTLFPCKGIDGWVLKREDYRREGKTFVTEAKEIEKMDLNISEMVIY